jgi:non-lysosomal glucosylceramidase
VENLRARFDGIKRNPWDEAECGHHYARAMSSWSSVVALSGFHYDGDKAHVSALPRLPHDHFQCFWSTGTGWGTYSLKRSQTGSVQLTLHVLAGTLPCQSCTLAATGTKAKAQLGAKQIEAQVTKGKVTFAERLEIKEDDQLILTVGA